VRAAGGASNGMDVCGRHVSVFLGLHPVERVYK
jgi:hypothetical protein